MNPTDPRTWKSMSQPPKRGHTVLRLILSRRSGDTHIFTNDFKPTKRGHTFVLQFLSRRSEDTYFHDEARARIFTTNFEPTKLGHNFYD
jgi:hypothetical protein